MKRSIRQVCGMIGSPSFYGSDLYQRHDDYQINAVKDIGVDTVFLNIAWSRPWLDSVNLEDVAMSKSYPCFSAEDMSVRRQEFLRRMNAVKEHNMKAMGLFGLPKYLDFSKYPEEYRELMGSTQSTVSADQNICVSNPNTIKLYTELIDDLLTEATALDGMLVYTFDELAEVCATESDCPRCKGIPLEIRIPRFLNVLYDGIQEIKPGFELWWEPWELSESQVYAICESLNPAITLSVHSTINEVYFVNVPDRFVRALAQLCRRQKRKLIVELFLSGSGEDLGPIASYPCPKLVLDQLASVNYLEGCIGIKEYYGLCVEHFSINEAALKEYLLSRADCPDAIIKGLANTYVENIRDAESLTDMWDYSSIALMYMPWDISWVMRFSNYLPYDDKQWGKVNFKSAMCTPWTTPSWLSSRRSFYHLVENSNLYNEALYDDVRTRLEFAISSASQALDIGNNINVKREYKAQLKRQLDALELFIICATYRANWQQLSYYTEKLRSNEKSEIIYPHVEELLLSEIENANRLIRYLESDSVKSFLLPTTDTVKSCLEKILVLRSHLDTLPEYWITTK